MWMNWWTIHFPQIPWNSSFHRIYVNQDSSRIWSSISRWGPFWYFWKVHVLKLGCWNFAYRLDLFKNMEFIALEKMDYCGRCRLCNFSEWQEARAPTKNLKYVKALRLRTTGSCKIRIIWVVSFLYYRDVEMVELHASKDGVCDMRITSKSICQPSPEAPVSVYLLISYAFSTITHSDVKVPFLVQKLQILEKLEKYSIFILCVKDFF